MVAGRIVEWLAAPDREQRLDPHPQPIRHVPRFRLVDTSRARRRLPADAAKAGRVASARGEPSSRSVRAVAGTGVDHFDLVVSDLDQSLAFYCGLLAPLGYTRTSEIVGERGERVIYLGGAGGVHFSLRQAQTPGTYDRYRVGIHHVAFQAPSRELVDERLSWVRNQGVEIESDPKEYDYRPGYYAGFFYDPDGIKLEVVHVP
jgi:glyoxylase I family protein